MVTVRRGLLVGGVLLAVLLAWLAVRAFSGPTILNERRTATREVGTNGTEEPVPAILSRIMNRLVNDFVDGKKVDYADLVQSDAFAEYRGLTQALKSFDLASLDSRKEQLAFWINLYNTLVIDATLESGVKKSVREKRGFFNRYAYRIGGLLFTPNDIEHGILRGVSIGADDPRFSYVLPRLDPRIHFALNCASSSCPPLAAYDAERIDEQLDAAARGFINDPSNVRLDKETNTLYLSRIFDWYREDFGFADDSVPRFLLKYLNEGDTREYIASHLDSIRVRYNTYDWSLNR